MSTGSRREQIAPALFFAACFTAVVFLAHSPFLSLPYFWDELGQFVPAALDILHDGKLVPFSTEPNVHPPGVMLWLALVWKAAGYSIPVTRAAMLLLASAGVFLAFLAAIHLSRGLKGAPGFIAVALVLADPLIGTQSMMAQLDMPAMVFTLTGLLLFLKGCHKLAALACVALVLSKETGILLPAVLAGALLVERRDTKQAWYYVAPFVALAAWLALLWHSTGYLLGNPGFAHYNVEYALHPVRIATSLLRRFWYLFVADGRWIGVPAVVLGWRRGVFRGPAWRVIGVFAFGHILLVSILGGAELERYLLPALPLLYIAVAAGWTAFAPRARILSAGALTLALIAGWFLNPPYPFPYENNLAMTDFVELHHRAAEYLEEFYPGETVYTAWPLTGALQRPEFGYVHRPFRTHETSDLHASTLSKLDPTQVRVLVLYSRTWEPDWGVLQNPFVRRFLERFYDYEPQLTANQARDRLGLRRAIRWTRRGQWIEVYSKDLAGH